MATQKSRSFPYIFKHAELHAIPVKGEMYDVNEETFRRLDILEGHPDHYRRQQIRVVTRRGEQYECATYILEDPALIEDIANGLGRGFVYVKDGDWTQAKVTP